MTQFSSDRKSQAGKRLGRILWGLDGAPTAFDLTRYAYLPPELQLQKRLMPEVRRGRRQSGWESPDRKRRVLTADRAALAALAASEREAGRPRSARRVQHLYDSLGRPTPNLANIHFDSRVRNCFASHVLAAVEALAPGTPTACYTLLSTSWIRPLPAIDGSEEPTLFGTLRAQLYRAGLGDLSGWCIVGLHGEHQLDGAVHRHPHALVVGEKAQAFEALRDLPEFKGGRGAPIEEPVQRDELRHPVRQIPYLLQHDWSFKTDNDPCSRTFGSRTSRRLPDQLAHGRYLVWRASRRFSDLVWMHGVRLRDGFLQPA